MARDTLPNLASIGHLSSRWKLCTIAARSGFTENVQRRRISSIGGGGASMTVLVDCSNSSTPVDVFVKFSNSNLRKVPVD